MRRSPLSRRKPLERRTLLKRGGPIKVRRKYVPAAERQHKARIAGMPCLICQKPPPSTVHHVRRRPQVMGLHGRCDRRIVPLCAAHHLHDHGPESVERLKESGFLERFGVDLWFAAEQLWSERDG